MRPFRLLLALFVMIPIVEIYLLIKVGGLIGAWPTVGLVLLTAVAGAALLRHQGFATLARAQATLARGEIPAIEMLEGVVVLVGGALLLTPGFFTDTLGLLCLIPSLRRRLVLWVIRRGVVVSPPRRDQRGSRTLEGEYWKDDGRR